MPMAVGAAPFLALFALTAALWLLILRARVGHLIAVPAAAGGAAIVLLVVLIASHLLHLEYMWAVGIASALAAALAVVLLRRIPGALRRPSAHAIALWCPALLGGLVWIVTVAVAQFLPGASRFGWAMNGDSLNNLYYASVIRSDNGVALGGTQNPVPLPGALIAVAEGFGSPANSTGGAALVHQLAAFTLVWTILLALTCLGTGVAVAVLIPRTQLVTVAIVSALGSLVPLTWFGAGLTIQWGYFNVNVLLPILLGAWLVYLAADRHPVAALVILLGLSLLCLAVWTPLILITACLGVALVVRRRAAFRRIRGRRLGAVVFGFALVLGFVGLQTVPTLLSQSGALGADGSGYLGFVNLWWAVPIVAVVVIASAIAARRRIHLPIASSVIAVGVGFGLATVLLLVFAGSAGFDAYYPKKLAWIFLLVGGLFALSSVFAIIVGRVSNTIVVFVSVVALAAAAITPTGTWPETLQRQPVVRISADYVRHEGEATVREIVRLTSKSHSTVLWQSGDPDEPILNEWLLLAHGGLVAGNSKLIALVGPPYFLYRAVGRYADTGERTLCRILAQLPGTTEVVTANAELPTLLRAACPTASANVVVTSSLKGYLPSRAGQNWQTDGIEGPFD